MGCLLPAINSQRSGKLNSTEAEQIPDPYYQIAKTTFARSSRKLPSMNSARAHPIETVCRFLGANTHVEFSQASRRQFTRANPSDYKLGSESSIHGVGYTCACVCSPPFNYCPDTQLLTNADTPAPHMTLPHVRFPEARVVHARQSLGFR